jgi:NAD(P)H-quinone oxidoreductase subunit 5
MNALFGFSIALVPALLLAQGLAPAQWVNRHPRITARWNFALVLAALAVCLWGIGWMAVSGPVDWRASISRHGLSLGIWFDPLAAVMMLLIGLIGLVITRYSLRYLDGEPTQGRFLRWLGFTLGAVLLLVVSRNLLMLAGAWMLTSFGLHQLLTHYPHRPGALTAARKKFLISRIGDALLLAALWLTYVQFGSFEYADVFAALDAADGTGAVPLIGVLFVLGAMTKSAQFPFHSWLPDTMEAPTPVSALMHAGIINAGGFLVLRLSPLISRSQAALDSLVLVGAFTALFGAAVMMTQTSIKRSLAYSTIAQMGFMMLQCGLGAYSAALLHIVAHSLYKAHAFLSSGSVVEGAAQMKAEPQAPIGAARSVLNLLLAAAVAALLYRGGARLLSYDPALRSGGALLELIMCVAMTQLIWTALNVSRWKLASGAVVAAALVSFSYFAAYTLLDRLLGAGFSRGAIPQSSYGGLLTGSVAIGFLAIFALQSLLGRHAGSRSLQALYVHAANGFYVDIYANRIVERLWGRPTDSR